MSLRLIRLGAKVGITYGLVYYTVQEGVWSADDLKSKEVYKKVMQTVLPLIKDSPVQIPELPRTDYMSYMAQHYWNKGVIASFSFLISLPDRAVEWSKMGYNMAKEQLQQKQDTQSQEQ